MKTKNTVIFDMDGTILDTLEDLTIAMNHVMSEFDFDKHTKEEYRHAFGNGIRFAIEQTTPNGTSKEVIDRMHPIFRAYYDEHCLDNTRPYDGILPLMKKMKDDGYKMAIVSNKIDSAVKELNLRFFSEYVDVAIGERAGIKRKPAPDTVIEALRELGSNVYEAVYIGDSEVDFETAKNSELDCITVLWGFRDKEYLEEIGADVFANTPEEVYELLCN
ncbi:MAG: HAD family hydrolase [Lachnospiraceae bacterium]|nr:HAD family hydrolase [Lachnospiraceae bacterium]